MLAIPLKRHGSTLRKLARHRWAPTAIAAAWAAWWSFFLIASATSESHEGLGAGLWVFNVALPLLVMWFAVVASACWRKAATALLLVIGAFVLIGYPFAGTPQFPVSTIIFVMATLGLPPFVAGLLLWRQRPTKRRVAREENTAGA